MRVEWPRNYNCLGERKRPPWKSPGRWRSTSVPVRTSSTCESGRQIRIKWGLGPSALISVISLLFTSCTVGIRGHNSSYVSWAWKEIWWLFIYWMDFIFSEMFFFFLHQSVIDFNIWGVYTDVIYWSSILMMKRRRVLNVVMFLLDVIVFYILFKLIFFFSLFYL